MRALKPAAAVIGGFSLTRVAYGFAVPVLAPYIPIDQPFARIGTKAALAMGIGWAGKRFLGPSTGDLLLIGGIVAALDDAVRTFVAPYFPALSDDMGVYPMLPGMGTYPGMGSYDSASSVSGYDEVA